MVFIQEIRKRGLKVSIVGIPKTIDNDIPVNTIYKLFFLFLFSFCQFLFYLYMHVNYQIYISLGHYVRVFLGHRQVIWF